MIKLSRLVLKNFKVYGKDPYTIIFGDNQLVLLDGPNGYGKTSVFDAIELALTGNIRRLVPLESRQNPSDIVVAHNGAKDVEILIEFQDDNSNKRVFQRKLKSTIANSAKRISNFSGLWEVNEIRDTHITPVDENTLNLFFNSKDFARDFLLFHYVQQDDTSRFLKSNTETRRAEELSKLFGDTLEADNNLQKLSDTRRKFATTRRDINTKIDGIKSLHKLEDIQNLSPGETEQHDYALPWLSSSENSPFWDRPSIAQLNEDRLNKSLAELAKIRDLIIHKTFFLGTRRYKQATLQKNIIELHIGYAKTYELYEQLERNHRNYQLVNRSKELLSSSDLKNMDRNLDIKKLFDTLELTNPEGFTDSIKSLLELIEKSQGLSSVYSELLKHHKSMQESIETLPTETLCGLCGHDHETHDTLTKAITKYGHILRTELGDHDRILVMAREAFETTHLTPLLMSCSSFLNSQQPPSQADLTTLAKAVAAKERLKRLRTWLDIEGIVDEDLLATTFPVQGGEAFISEKADILCERIRSLIGTPPEGYYELYGEDIFERIYLDYFNSEPEKLREFEPTILDQKERFIKSQYFSSLTEVAAELIRLQYQDTLLGKALDDIGEIIATVSYQIGNYRKKLITDIEIPFYIYSGKILQSHQAGLGQGVFIKDPLGEDILKNVRLVSDWKTDHDIMNTMSSGQISAVVIALTLALNRVYSKNFTTILIDDPVQTMDDINMSSLVELLRNDFCDKQIILSTHEDKVARYFTYKYIKHSGKVKIINLMQRKEYVPTNSYVYRPAFKPNVPSAE